MVKPQSIKTFSYQSFAITSIKGSKDTNGYLNARMNEKFEQKRSETFIPEKKSF
jgi:hypothetical protein